MKEEYASLRAEIQQNFMLQFLALGFSLTTLITVFNLTSAVWNNFPPQVIAGLLLVFLSGIARIIDYLDTQTSLAATYVLVFIEEGNETGRSSFGWERRLKVYRTDEALRRAARIAADALQRPKVRFYRGITFIIAIEMIVCSTVPLFLAWEKVKGFPEARIGEILSSPQTINWGFYVISAAGALVSCILLGSPPPWHKHETFWRTLKDREKEEKKAK